MLSRGLPQPDPRLPAVRELDVGAAEGAKVICVSAASKV
jgi:hypothetical protein